MQWKMDLISIRVTQQFIAESSIGSSHSTGDPVGYTAYI